MWEAKPHIPQLDTTAILTTNWYYWTAARTALEEVRLETALLNKLLLKKMKLDAALLHTLLLKNCNKRQRIDS